MTTEALTPEKLEELLEADYRDLRDQITLVHMADLGFVQVEPYRLAVILDIVEQVPALLAIARREERLREALDELEGRWLTAASEYGLMQGLPAGAYRECLEQLREVRGEQPHYIGDDCTEEDGGHFDALARAALTPEEGPLPSSEWEPDDELAGLPVTPEEGQAPE